MATSLAGQLSRIAAESTHSLNLKAQKAAHSKSLIFEPRVAASQSLESLYALCHEGFQELCLLDARFLDYQRSLFSEASIEEDRTLMTAAEAAKLDSKLESFLGLVGGRLRLSPAIKAVEWLVRRFSVHEYNTSFLITTFLPYHTLPVFTAILSILPTDIPPQYRFLHPYIRSLTPPPRHTIVHTAANNLLFASSFNAYVLLLCNAGHHYAALVTFWAGVVTEATSSMLDKMRSGRQGVQYQNEQDAVLRLLPTINEALAMRRVPELQIGCYMLLAVIASKSGLDDRILTAMMEALVLGWSSETISPGLVCLLVLAQHRHAKQFTKRVTKELLKIPDLTNILVQLSKQRRVDKLANGFCLSLVDRLRKQGDLNGLSIVEKFIEKDLLSEAQVSVIVKSLLLLAHQVDDIASPQADMRSYLASSLTRLTQLHGRIGAVVQESLKETEIDIDSLELDLRTAITTQREPPAQVEDVEMDDDHVDVKTQATSFSTLLKHLPKKTVNESSFLTHTASHIYPDLCRAFLASMGKPADIDSFDEAPILQRESATDTPPYISFYIRTWCGPQPALVRKRALQMVGRCLSHRKWANMDVQALIPYAVAALADPAIKVRRAAAELLATTEKFYPKSFESKKDSKNVKQWAANELYGHGDHNREVKWLSPDVVISLLREVLVPALEECVLDQNHLISVFQKSLGNFRNTEAPRKNESPRLSQASRTQILLCFASHIIQSPLYSVKLRLLTIFNQTRGVASLTRTKVLLPLLEQWVSFTPSEALKHGRDEEIDCQEFDNQSVLIVVANDKEGVQYLIRLLNDNTLRDRPTILDAVFNRIRSLWPSLKSDMRLYTAQSFLDLSQRTPEDSNYSRRASEGSAELLRTLPLPADVLESFLSGLAPTLDLADKSPANKRRRTSHGEIARTSLQDPKEVQATIRRVTFTLQLVDSSGPSQHPELLKVLFNTLAELQHFKIQITSELAYLQVLVLGALLAIVQAHRANSNMKIDHCAVRADLLVDCVQKTASPQVQNAALLLIAALADAVPEVVLHSVMPIFTFMGSSVLRQNDDYSAHVISQTIRDVIPPLISSLRKEKGDPVTGAAELLLSFVAAYEHVPSHRRKALYVSLVQTLGAEDFLFALLAMLIDKYGSNEAIKSFAVEISGSFGVEVQLHSVVKHLDLVGDVFKSKPTYSAALLGASEEESFDAQKIAFNQVSLLPNILSQKRLATQTGKLLDRDDMDAARVRDLYSTLMEKTLALADSCKGQNRLRSAVGSLLESLFGLLSASEFVKSVEGLLDRPNQTLRRKILQSLEVRVEQEHQSDSTSRIAMLGFLPQLTAIVRESDDVLLKHIAVACVDKISEKYGKKDLEAVSAAAETIASKHCLGQTDNRLRIMALLCLASLVDILREGIVSVLPIATPTTLDYLEASVTEDSTALKLHNAGYSFVAALAHHLPYMISGPYLNRILPISNASAEANLGDDADESRVSFLQLAARSVDAKTMFTALEKNWGLAVAAGISATRENIDILRAAIEKHPKSVVTKHSAILAKIFQNAFDLRRIWALDADGRFADEEISNIEQSVIDVAITMIYKFNDATFRPIFSGLIDWAASGLPKKDKTGRMLRIQSIYGFMAVFFENLRSIVTSYATYLLDNSVVVLKAVNAKDERSKELWARVLRTLAKCFEHDQDDFWQSPSHFGVIAPVLVEQFAHASALPVIEELVPAIVELAAAADSSEHHKELNGAILKHMRSENAHVRLAAVKCEQELTDRLGEEWLSMLPEMLPFISELQEDDDEIVERETLKWIVKIEGVLGESLDSMLQ